MSAPRKSRAPQRGTESVRAKVESSAPPSAHGERALRESEERCKRAETILRVVVEASATLSTSLDYDTTLVTFARALVPDHGDWCMIDLVDESAPLRLVALAHVDPEKAAVGRQLRELYPPMSDEGSGTRRVLRTGRSVLLAEITDAQLAAASRDAQHLSLLRAIGMRSAIIVPLNARGRTLGVLTLASSTEGHLYEEGDLQLVEEAASRAALAVDTALLHRHLEAQSARLRILADASRIFAESGLDLQEVKDVIARYVARAVGDCVVLRLADASGGDLVVEALAHKDVGAEAELRTKLAEWAQSAASGLHGDVMRTGAPALVADYDPLAIFSPHHPAVAYSQQRRFHSVVAVPLRARGTSIGTLGLARERGSPTFTTDDLQLLQELGDRAGMAIESARLFAAEEKSSARLRVLAEENARLLTQARDSVALRDDFLAIASHELNTPLTPLMIQLDSLKRGDHSPEKTAVKLDLARRQVARIARLVSQLLDVSHMSGGRLVLELETVDLAALARDAIARMDTELRGTSTIVTLQADEAVVGDWDRARIDQVIGSLVSNAVKYGQGKPVDVVVDRSGDNARLVVRDHGIGIDGDHQARIFERFERACSARHYGGFGLGLWIVNQIVDASGGTISVRSAAGEGSTFTVELPRDASGRARTRGGYS